MIELAKISERLKEVIRQSGMTQTKLAQKINICQQTISHYVKGDKLPSLDTFANLCAVLDIDPSYILCLSDMM